MSEYLKLKKSNCKNCYKCIRHCPVKSIRFSDNQAHIVTDECILCGRCFVACPQNAKEIADGTEIARVLLDGTAPVVATMEPTPTAFWFGSLLAGSVISGAPGLRDVMISSIHRVGPGSTDPRR